MELHGVLLRVAGCGIFIQGPAGCGKSQLALELLERGHQFVGDDLIHLRRDGDELIGKGVGLCGQFLSLRCGLVIEVARRYGPASQAPQQTVDLVITQGLARNLAPQTWSMLGLKRDCYALKQLPSSALVVEALAKSWQDQQQGYDAHEKLFQLQHRLLRSSA